MSITTEATGLIYRNPRPSLRAIHAWHPTVTLLESGDMLAAFDLGQGCESLDYCTHLSRSVDSGATWESPRTFLPDCPTRRANTVARIRAIQDGTVVALGGYLYRDDDDRGVVNPENLGYTSMELFVSRSGDGGQTWETPAVIAPPLEGPSWEICHSVVELNDGRWLAPMSTWKGWEGEAPNGMKAVALVSHDRGRTWPDYITVMDDYVNGLCHFEQSLVELPDGRLLAVAWALHVESGETRSTPYAISQDGRTFRSPRPTGLRGQTAKIIALRDGRILCVYRRHDKPGLWAALARIEGDDWVNLAEAPLWEGATSGMSGAAKPGEEITELRFGFPNLTLLPDGKVFVAFWCQEDCIGNIRWLRLRME